MLEQPARRTYEVLQDAKRTLEEEGKLPRGQAPVGTGVMVVQHYYLNYAKSRR